MHVDGHTREVTRYESAIEEKKKEQQQHRKSTGSQADQYTTH